MNRTIVAYYRAERDRLTERLRDVQTATQTGRTRLVELEREEKLLSELLAALDAHVPAIETTELLRIRGAA